MYWKMKSIILVLLASLAFSACAPAVSPAPEGAQPVTLKLALLPVLDALPIYVAQQEGLFEKNGVSVEVIPVGSAAERDQLISAGQADGMINEPVSVIFYNRDQVQVQTVRYAQTATPDRAMFSILAAKNSGIQGPQDLKGVPIGISEGTVIEYLTDRLLKAEGLAPEDIQGVAVPKISDRMALLDSGELKAGMLPEPLTTLAEQGGATVALDDTRHPEYSYSVISFRKTVIDQNPEAIRGFLAAIEQATGLINEEPSRYGSLLADQKIVPPSISGSFQTPTFVTRGVPTQEQWQDVLDWMQVKGLIDQEVDYAGSVTDAFLP